MKKFFSAILLMTMMVFSVGTFVSCNDLVNEIEGVKGQATELEAAVDALEAEIATLETALQNAKAEAADAAAKAKAAADEAQKTGDAAAQAAKDAAAVAAAAQASADALEAQLAEAQKTLQAALDGKADKADVEAAVKEIEALKAALDGKADKTDVEALKKQIEVIEAALKNYDTLLNDLKLKDAELAEAISYNLEAITNLKGQLDAQDMRVEDLETAVADLKKLVEELNANLTAYGDVIPGLVQMIQSVVYVPETADGNMVATGYALGDKKSDLFVKATYEVTPAKYAAELTNANVKFTTVPVTKAEPAEVVAAEIVEAKDGRVTVYARVSKNNKKTYEALTTDGAAALSLVITDEETETIDSTDVTYGTNVKSAYTTVLPVDTDGYVAVQDLVKVYNNVTGKWVANTAYADDAFSQIEVPYTDFAAKTPLSVYELRVDMEGQKMTIAEAAEFVGYAITAKVTTTDPTFVTGSDAVIKVTKADYASTFQLQLPQNVQNLTAYIGKAAAITVNNVKVNDTVCPYAVGVKGKVVIAYADASDVTFESYDAGAWSYTYYVGGQHVYAKSGLVKELDVTANVNINNLAHGSIALVDGAVVSNVPMVAKYTVDGQERTANGSFSYRVLNSKSVMITAINLPIVDQALTYKANFTLADNSNMLNYTASFTATVGARPADKEITLGDLSYTGNIRGGVTKAVAPMSSVLSVDGAYYTDILSMQNPYPTVNAGIGTLVHDANATAQLANVAFAGTPVAETSRINVAAVTAYGTKYTVKTTVPFYGINYTFVGSLTVNKPNYAIKNSALLINPSTGIGDILGDVKYPSKSGNTVTPGSAFVLNQIDLRDYVVITNDGANATEALLNSGEFKLKYELISKYDHDNDANTDMVVYPGVTFDGGNTTATLASALNATNVVAWNNATSKFTTAKFRVTLVADNGAKVKVDNVDVADNFGSTEFTLQIPDLVAMTTTSKVPVEEFVPGSTGVKINVIENLKVTDFNGKSLIGAKAKDLASLWDLTAGGAEYKLYNQNVVVLNVPAAGVVPTAVVESTGDTLYYGTDFTVDANGDVNLLLTDLNIQSSVVVNVPLMLTHVYQDASDATNMVVAKVKFTPVK